MRQNLILLGLLLGVGCQGVGSLGYNGKSTPPGSQQVERPKALASNQSGTPAKQERLVPVPSGIRDNLVVGKQDRLVLGPVTREGTSQSTPVVQTGHSAENGTAANPTTQKPGPLPQTPPSPAAAPTPVGPPTTVITLGTVNPNLSTAGSAPLPGPNLVAAHVQTTTTYRHHCNLGMDHLHLSIPIPHLTIFTGPDKVVTQTSYTKATEPARADPLPLASQAGRSGEAHVVVTTTTNLPPPAGAPTYLPVPAREIVLPPIR